MPRLMHPICTLLLACMSACLLAGCLTERILRTTYENVDEYKERVGSILITSGGDHLIVVGERHTYVFNDAERLVRAISGDVRPYLRANLQTFVVSGSEISGGVNLTLENLPADLAQHARSVGYRRSHEENRMYLSLRPSGIRYITNGEAVVASTSDLTTQYSVRVIERKRRRNPMLIAAPITLAADGAMFAFGAVLVSVATAFSGPE